MRNYIVVLVSLISISCTSSPDIKEPTGNSIKSGSEPAPVKVEDKIPKTIAEIKERYLSVSNKLKLGELDSASINYDCDGEKRGAVTYFSDHGQLRMVRHRYNEYDHFSATDTYYLQNGILYFTYSNQVTWSFVSGAAAKGVTNDRTTEKRIYLSGSNPLLCLEKVYVMRSDSPDLQVSTKAKNNEVDCSAAISARKAFDKLLLFRTRKDVFCK